MSKPPTSPTVAPPPYIAPGHEDKEPSALPAGVQTHDANRPPIAPIEDLDTRVRKDPPPGWQGGYVRCGGCGDFLPDEQCAKCAAQVPSGPQNMMLATTPKVVA